MLLPSYLVWAVWVAIGAQVMGDWFARRGVPLFATALVGLLAIGVLTLNFSRVDLSADWSARRRGEQILASLPPAAVYLGVWADVPILQYLQIVEGSRPDVRVENLLAESGRGGRLAADALRAGHAVYTATPDQLDDVGGLCSHYVAACDCYRIADDDCPEVADK